MSNFRIIAIKTGTNGTSPRNFLKSSKEVVDIDYLKNLIPNTVYSFYNNYTFPFNNFTRIEYDSKNDINLYSIKLSNGKNIPVNINAIVGENGSGKSTLIELIYWMNFNLGCKFGLLKTWKGENYLINELLDLELLYQITDGSYCILKFNNGKIDQLEVKFHDNNFELLKKPDWKPVTKIADIPDFFYSIVVNYSQYALNALEVGEWINPLFHKNDGYQTPIVLNPMRIDGDIDINKEKLLLSRRLQSNVLEKIAVNTKLKDSLRNLSNGKLATIIRVEYNSKYLSDAEKKHGPIEQKDLRDIMLGIKTHFGVELEERNIDYNYFVKYISDYIFYKLKKIVFNYPIYIDYREGNSIKNIDELLGKIKNSDSHITFKVKGAILHLKYFDIIYQNSKFNFNNPFDIDIEYFSNVIHSKIKEDFFVNTYMMAMPSFFNVEIVPDNYLSMNNFSSGEKQKIFSLSSIIYHLINLNSVEKLGTDFTNYKYINIILDEIEMYYHPEWQRKYINDLIEYTSKINPENLKQIKGINLTFLTHSPFILSDIPSNNIIRLADGFTQKSLLDDQTFGANIYDLLDNDFFMKNGFIGEYAMCKIKEILDYVSIENYDKINHDYFLSVVNIIGDEVIKQKLSQLLSDMHTNSLDDNQRKIKILKNQQKEIQEQLKKLEKQ